MKSTLSSANKSVGKIFYKTDKVNSSSVFSAGITSISSTKLISFPITSTVLFAVAVVFPFPVNAQEEIPISSTPPATATVGNSDISSGSVEAILEVVWKVAEQQVIVPPHPVFGDFMSWSKGPQGKTVIRETGRLMSLFRSAETLRIKAEDEKRENDASETQDVILTENIFTEISGRFLFVKGLGDGDLLFSAQDGLFIVRLNPGETVWVSPLTNYQVTAHHRPQDGDIFLTNGARVPVFRNGASPTLPRLVPGNHPNRKKEKALTRDTKTALAKFEGQLKATCASFKKEDDQWICLHKAITKAKSNAIVETAFRDTTKQSTIDLNMLVKEPNGSAVFQISSLHTAQDANEFIMIDPTSFFEKTALTSSEHRAVPLSQAASQWLKGIILEKDQVQLKCQTNGKDWNDANFQEIANPVGMHLWSCGGDGAPLTGIRWESSIPSKIGCSRGAEDITADCSVEAEGNYLSSITWDVAPNSKHAVLVCQLSSGEFSPCRSTDGFSRVFLVSLPLLSRGNTGTEGNQPPPNPQSQVEKETTTDNEETK